MLHIKCHAIYIKEQYILSHLICDIVFVNILQPRVREHNNWVSITSLIVQHTEVYTYTSGGDFLLFKKQQYAHTLSTRPPAKRSRANHGM